VTGSIHGKPGRTIIDRDSSHRRLGGDLIKLGREGYQQGTMYLTWDGIPLSRGPAFYDRPQQVQRKCDFDAFSERLCKSFYSKKC